MHYYSALTSKTTDNKPLKLTSNDIAHLLQPFDFGQMASIKKKLGNKLHKIIVIGIGGSSVGTKALYNSLFAKIEGNSPNIVFLETLSEKERTNLTNKLVTSKPEEIAIVAVSKSGKTKETLDNLNYLLQKFPELKSRVVTITQKDSPLYNHMFDNLELNSQISGRYSVFTYVGMFPLFLAGFDITKILNEIQTNDLSDIKTAAHTKYQLYKKNKFINTLFIFDPTLASIGEWYKQLLAESTGKNGKGILPNISIGTNDMHSMAQLYLGGHNENFTFTFLSSKKEHLLQHALSSVKTAFAQKNLPFDEFILDDINEAELTKFMWFKLIETIFISKLMDLNPFDQPDVDNFKKLT